MGMKRLSVRKPPNGFLPRVRDVLAEAMPDGRFDENSGDFLVFEPQTIFSLLNLPPTPQFDFNEEGGWNAVAAVRQPGPVAIQPAAAAADAVPHFEGDNADVEAGFALVVHYQPLDINGLPPAERVVALYGSQEGQRAWNSISKSFRDGLAKTLPAGPLRGHEYLVYVATKIRSQERLIPDRELLLLAGGRFVAWKGSFVFEGDGMWRKKV